MGSTESTIDRNQTQHKDKKTFKILVADEISHEGIDILEQALAVSYQPQISASQLLDVIGEFDALLVRSRTKVTRDVLKKGVNLKIVGRAGVGVDNIDIPAATEAGILVANSPEGNTASAAEHTVALMFALARLIPQADSSVKAGQWERKRFMGCELFNKTLGVIGLGKVGGRVAHAAQALGMKVIVFDPLLSAERASQLNMWLVPLEEIWRRADFITIHTPKNRETTNLINSAVLSRVKPGVRIVNTSRGGIIDEAALAQAIKDGRVAGAALDVFSEEPPAQSALLELAGKVVLTPHIGASTVEAQFNVAIDLAEQIRDYLATGLARSPVNLPFMRPEVLKGLGKYMWLSEAMATIASELADGAIKDVEVVACGTLASKDTSPLMVAALRGLLQRKMESVTYVNAHLIARNNGIQVRESKSEETNQFRDEVSVIISTDRGKTAISGTVLAHNEPIVTHINNHAINLTPSRYMLFTAHRDQPGIVAKVSGVLGKNDVNISTMGVGRKGVREEAVMVMTLDDPLSPLLVEELSRLDGINKACFVALESGIPDNI